VPTALCAGLPGIAGSGPGCALPSRVGFERGGSECFEPGEQFAQPPVVGDPGLVVVVLVTTCGPSPVELRGLEP